MTATYTKASQVNNSIELLKIKKVPMMQPGIGQLINMLGTSNN